MLKIRLQRIGRVHEPTYRLVLTDSKNGTRSGKFLEVLGSHDSRNDKSTAIKSDRVKYWMNQGAQASGTVHNLLITHKVITGKKINVLPKKTVVKKDEPVAEAPKAAPAPESAPAPAPEPEAAPESTPVEQAPAEEASAAQA